MRCPICSKELLAGARLCSECDTTLERVEYQVKASERAMEIKPGAALCASIEGYIRLCEVLPLPEVGAIVNEYLERMLPIVQAEGGQVNWYSGDKIVAYFGMSEVADPHPAATRAVQAALSLLQSFAEFSGELMNSYARDVELELRVGIASGELLRGTLGDAALERPAWSSRSVRRDNEPTGNRPRYRRMVIGDVVNLAIQLEYEARPGHILTDQTTCEAAQTEFDFQSVGLRTLRRRSEPVELFSLIGPKQPLGAAALVGAAHF